ncbi:hypothetical protein, partial [Caballeronia novacaledonica]|uniref:hypothetical protein n=1 Tax=Caballeronia novacaledonica TaxID=1544861 RepID=UPI001EE34477
YCFSVPLETGRSLNVLTMIVHPKMKNLPLILRVRLLILLLVVPAQKTETALAIKRPHLSAVSF